jgi:hypothetical protein
MVVLTRMAFVKQWPSWSLKEGTSSARIPNGDIYLECGKNDSVLRKTEYYPFKGNVSK